MSFLRFEDQADGVHVFFADVTNHGPLGTVSSFNTSEIATLDRAYSHFIQFSIDFKDGTAKDSVSIFIDDKLAANGTTWENYYRYDPEQAGNGNTVPTVDKLLFRQSGAPSPGTLGNGFLLDRVTLASSGRNERK